MKPGNFDKIVFKSKIMKEIIALSEKVADSDASVLIQGETGVGKDVVAALIHNLGKRKDKPYVKINCASLPETLFETELFGYEKGAFTSALDSGKTGLLELANHGTLLLDEVNTIPLNSQPKLLRVLHEGEIMKIGGLSYTSINTRIMATSNIDLRLSIKNNAFREDLFYRLNVVPIIIPPLRERKEDIIPLIEYYLSYYNNKYGFDKRIDEETSQLFLPYKWPGNVRELKNIIERLVLTSGKNIISNLEVATQFSEVNIEGLHLGNNLIYGLKDVVNRYEKAIIMKNMQYYNRSQELANALRIDKSTLTRKMKKYGIKNTYIED